LRKKSEATERPKTRSRPRQQFPKFPRDETPAKKAGHLRVPHGVARAAPVLVSGPFRVPHVQDVAFLLEHGVQHLEPPEVGLAQV
jgi:hypothetical protein